MSVDRDKMASLLIEHEGMRPTPYQDSRGIWTVGIGHNLQCPLSHAAIMQIFNDDLDEAYNQCLHSFSWFADLNEARQMVLIDMCFNLGLPRLLGFQKMLNALSLGNYETAASEMLASAWAGQVGQRAVTLAAMMRGSETA